jgi:hypothetical protein
MVLFGAGGLLAQHPVFFVSARAVRSTACATADSDHRRFEANTGAESCSAPAVGARLRAGAAVCRPHSSSLAVEACQKIGRARDDDSRMAGLNGFDLSAFQQLVKEPPVIDRWRKSIHRGASQFL